MKQPNELLPSDIDLTNHFWDSPFRNFEAETVARNIVVISNAADPNAWTPFSFDDYKERCKHRASELEHGVMQAFLIGGRPVPDTTSVLEPGYLTKEGGKYAVTEKFLAVIAKFAKP
jgi:hypothetical protein